MGRGAGVVLVDGLLRRLVLPLVLTFAVVFRYNVLSLIYLLMFIVSFLLPGSLTKARKASNLVFLGLLLAFSAVAAVGQAFFQIALATDYSQQLHPCDQKESVWRQFGFILYSVPGADHVYAVDVVRHLLPDVVVFATTLLTLIFNAKVVAGLVREGKREEKRREMQTGREGQTREGSEEPVAAGSSEASGSGRNSELPDVAGDLKLEPPFPSNVQCYFKLPHFVVLLFDASVFIILGLAGVALPSLTSFTYYAIFLVLLVVWSLHLQLRGLERVLRCLLTFYTALHLIALYLYQFQSAQEHIPLEPHNTSKSLLARLFGLSAIIRTDCERPTQLLVHSDLEYPVFVSPALLLLLFWILATEFRLWLGTPRSLWKDQYVYYLPVGDMHPSSTVVCLVRRNRHLLPAVWTQYGTCTYRSAGKTSEASGVDGGSAVEHGDVGYAEYRERGEGREGDETGPEVVLRHKRIVTWEGVKRRVVQGAIVVWDLLLSTSYVLAIICMMLWSVLYPSWPALVLLLWACAIWLIPKVTPRNSLYYTSPLLVLYAVALLLLQYIFSLNLTSDELAPRDGLGEECVAEQCVDVMEGSGSTYTDCSPTPGCKSFVPLIKTVFTIVFFAAFHEFVKMAKDRYQESRQHSDSTDGRVAEEGTAPTVAETLRDKLYHSTLPLLSNYWVLLVIGAFLLVTLTGEPNLFKTIYLVFFFVFLITYQVFRGWWYYVCVPVWWGLVIYAVLELLLIYTYQFESVSGLWDKAYNSTPDLTVDSEDLFNSIGLRKYGINSLRSLIISLIPPAIFIAVMALQLRYFKPTWTLTTPPEISMSSVDLTSLLPAALRSSFINAPPPTRDSTVVVDVHTHEDEEGEEGEGGITSRPLSRASSVASSVAPGTPLYHCYRLTVYLLLKSRQIIVELVHTSWRFLELHVHKMAMLVLFTVALSEISASYWVLLGLLLLVTLLPYFNPILYPLLTLYLGLLATVKTIYQFPIIQKDQFNISDDSNDTCYWTLNDSAVTGQVFHYRYSSRDGDGAWFGLHKVDNYATYIAGPICIVLLLSLWFTVRRHQASFYHSRHITIDAWERGSLFLGVTRQEAEKSILVACKYFINHTFEMYGIEITLVMLAITVAVRIDVYGMIYCSVLGLLLLVPRRVMAPVWLSVIVVHGLLLTVQYAMLLGVPAGACFSPGGSRDYPWNDIDGKHGTALKKWLFLTDYPQILDKNILYVDFLVYILLCLQIYNFRPWREVETRLTDFLRTESLINSLKIFITQYFFWVSLFLIFFSAVSRVSLLGILYLLMCFIFLYRGQTLLTDRQNNRKRSWAGLRLLAWVILLIRVSVQIADCVFYDNLNEDSQCLLILVLNGACNRRNFYGSPEPLCSSSPANVGLWVDALTFTIITVQIIIFDTQYSEMLREYLIEREEKAGYFADVFDAKMEEKQQKAKETKEREFAELKERAEELSITENTVDHVLYAGVRIPPDIHLRLRHKATDTDSQREEDLDTASLELSGATYEEPKSKTPVDGDSDGILEEEPGKLYRFWKFVCKALIEFVDYVIVWLEKSSALYVEIVEELKNQEEQAEQEEEQEETAAVTEGKKHATYGSIQEVQVEVHTEDKESVDSYKMATSDDHRIAEDMQPPSPPRPTSITPEHPSETMPLTRKTVHFDEGRDTVRSSAPAEDDGHIAEFEEDFEKVALKYRQRPMRFLRALRNATLAHAEYIVYFLVILNVMLNGSVLSLGYACLLFGWGLLSIPWPSKTFWLTMIFYSMVVLVIKYAFQFHNIDYGSKFDPESGLYLPHVLGIEYYDNFFSNAAWDMLLLISLLFNRGLLKQSGLWRHHRKQEASNIFVTLWYDFKRFFFRLLSPDVSQGASDYYVVMLFFDTLCLLTIVFGVSSFGIGIAGQGAGQAAKFIQNNYIPIPFVIMLLLQFLSMLVDRAIYLRHALKAKVAFQIFLLVVWHLWLLFLLPSDLITRTPFTKNVAAQCIYFFKCLYFIVSAMQIVSGYPTRVLGYFIGQTYTTVSGLLFTGYRAIPLLPELREIMDWVFTDTALSLFHWLRVQEIYAQLYLVKVRRNREMDSPRDLGEKQSLVIKILLGGLLLIGLVLLIWGPLLVISFINSTSLANPPVAATLSLQLDGYEPLVEITVQRDSLKTLSDSEYRSFQRSLQPEVQPVFNSQFFRDDFTRAVFPNESTSLWTISPPARQLLQNTLEMVRSSNSSVALQFSWTITREPSSSLASEVVSGVSSRSLTYRSDKRAVDALINTLMMNDSEVFLPNLYPRLIIAPDTGPSENFTELSSSFRTSPNVSCTTRLESNSSLEWWTLNECSNTLDPSSMGGPELLIYSSRIAPPLFSAIAGLGIIGLYVSVVLVIGRLIRGYISSLPSQLLIDEIVNPNPLLKLCKDIFTVREGKDFKLEEILVGKLFAIFRSPERLVQLTDNTKKKKD